MAVDPAATEIHYSCDMLAYHLASAQPAQIRIATLSTELALAMARRLGELPCELLVEHATIQALLSQKLGIAAGLVDEHAADAVVFPFSLEEGALPKGEALVVAACRNALSYKSLRYPGLLRRTVFASMRALQPAYRVRPVASLYAPSFIARWMLAHIVGQFSSPRHFALRQQALDRLIHYGPWWPLSYIVVIKGHHAR